MIMYQTEGPVFLRWTRAYSRGPEIWKYLFDFATYYNLHKYIK